MIRALLFTCLVPAACSIKLATEDADRLVGGTFNKGVQSANRTKPDVGISLFWGHHVVKDHTDLPGVVWIVPPPRVPALLGRTTKEITKVQYSQTGQDNLLLPVLRNIKDGFFVESGAFDGETHSNTLMYERNFGWTGLLVEPVKASFDTIQGRHRNAYLFNGALSPTRDIEKIVFHDKFCAKGSECGSLTAGHSTWSSVFAPEAVQCVPLQNLLTQIGRRTVDFWSLDIEGSEGEVLQATDFQWIEVGILLIEMNKGNENNRVIRDVMSRNGFVEVLHWQFDNIFANPKYFAKRGLDMPDFKKLPTQYKEFQKSRTRK